MSMPLDRPAPPGDQFDCATHVGALLVIDVQEHVRGISTKVSKEPQDAIRGNVYVISPQGTVAETFQNTLLFPRMLVARLQQSLGRKVVGLLTGQPGVQRDGRNVPYDLDDPNDAMYAAASQAMTQLSMQAAPAQQWGQQPATQAGPWGQQPQQPSGPPPGWGGQQQAPTGPPPGWGQQPQQPAGGGWQQPQQGPPPGWGQQAQAAQPPAQQPQGDTPPWEQNQPPAAGPPWAGQQ